MRQNGTSQAPPTRRSTVRCQGQPGSFCGLVFRFSRREAGTSPAPGLTFMMSNRFLRVM
jgi:hypothetical protein